MNTTTTKIAGEAMTDEQLKPCPFCGCTTSPELKGNGIGDNWLECVECGASTRLREDGAGSTKDWNRRALLASKPAVPEGWKLVPVEPTDAMVDAACPVGEAVDHFDMKTALREAIAASTAPAQSCGDAEQEAAPTHSSGHHLEYVKGFNAGKREFSNAFELGIEEGKRSASERADEAATLPEMFKSPLTSFGLLVRALRIVADTTLYDMAKALSSTPATLSAVECGRKPLTEEMVIDTYVFFTKLGVLDTLHALNAARAKDSK